MENAQRLVLLSLQSLGYFILEGATRRFTILCNQLRRSMLSLVTVSSSILGFITLEDGAVAASYQAAVENSYTTSWDSMWPPVS
jgi:hypothetical protein